MPTEIDPKKFQQAVEKGFERLANFRSARLLFLRQFVGQYYDAEKGRVGSEPLNLIFNAIRVLVPSIVYNFPKHNVSTEFLAQRSYADMLGMALTQQDKKLKLKDVYRRWIVDACFTIGILKTGLCDSGTAVQFEDGAVDPGTVYTSGVDFDNFVFDPNARILDPGGCLFMGDRMRVSRTSLLDSGLYRNDLVERLPSSNAGYMGENRVDQLSSRNINFQETAEFEDEVEICELWVPRAKAIVTVPACAAGYTSEDFLRTADYYGPDDGPYTLLKFTPPVPNNPMPVSMVGIWYDLHVMANKMAKKIMEQADRQKDIVGYKRSAADDAQEALDAGDGEAVAMDDPEGLKTFSFGGQNRTNEAHVVQLQQWFNMMAGNPEGMAGLSMNAKTASEANLLQGNAQTSIEDMKDLVYIGCAEEARKRAFYLHTDPLIEVPLIRRVRTPAQFGAGPSGPLMISPAQEQEVQVFLTPEARSGDFLDFMFEIEPESMGRVDSRRRVEQAMNFATKILPAAAAAAQTCMTMGVSFSFPRFCVRMAKENGIKWMDEIFMDPEFQQQMMAVMTRGPQEGPSKGSIQGGLPGIMQNGQPPNVGASALTPQQQFNTDAQAGAAEGQATLMGRSEYQ
jgi:hypothetical protein